MFRSGHLLMPPSAQTSFLFLHKSFPVMTNIYLQYSVSSGKRHHPVACQPSPLYVPNSVCFCACVHACSVMFNSLWPHGLQSARLLSVPGTFQVRIMGSQFLFHRIYFLNSLSVPSTSTVLSVKCVSRSVVPDSLRPHEPQPSRLLCPWDFPGKDTGVGCHFLLQGIFPTQELNPGFLYYRQIL